MQKEYGFSVTVTDIIFEIQKKLPKLEKSLKVMREIVYRFLARNSFTFRVPIHIGQPVPADYQEKIQKFLQYIIKLRQKLNFFNFYTKNNLKIQNKKYDFPMSRIINLDESAFYVFCHKFKKFKQFDIKSISI